MACTAYVRAWVGAQGGQRLPVPALGVAVEVVDVDVGGPSVVVAIDRSERARASAPAPGRRHPRFSSAACASLAAVHALGDPEQDAGQNYQYPQDWLTLADAKYFATQRS